MSFASALALLVGVLVAAPWIAHRLRRRKGEERPFAAAHLVPPAPPRARRRAELEDVGLFAIRALAVLALAALGASPLVRCSRLSLTRTSGASVALAIVLDDSMSMRAPSSPDGPSRLERAKRAAAELLASSRDGDAVAVVLAGAPPRVALAATGDIGAARAVVDALVASDRATDLEGAITIAGGLVAQLPHVDRRIVLLSDMADGKSSAPPLGSGDVPLWVPLRDLASPLPDCAVVTADRGRGVVRARLACGPSGVAPDRVVQVIAGEKGEKVIASASPGAIGVAGADVTLSVPDDVAPPLAVKLTGGDAVASNDAAPVVVEASASAIAVVVERGSETLPTGGAPPVEQALASLKLDVATRPLPVLPDRAEDLAGFVGVIVDDPPGFTPEQRRAVRTFVEEGGVFMVALGPRAAAAPLGSSFDPMFERQVTWEKTASPGVDVKSVRGALAESAATFLQLGARDRAVLSGSDREQFEVLAAWTDGAPLVLRRTLGRGEASIVTLPFSVDASDLPLRPGFLPMLDTWVDAARARVSDRRTEVGDPWVFVSGGRNVEVRGPAGSVKVTREGNVARAVPEQVGAYDFTFAGGRKEQRVAVPAPRELNLRPRAVTESASTAQVGDTKATVDISWVVALVLLGLTGLELALRVNASQKREA